MTAVTIEPAAALRARCRSRTRPAGCFAVRVVAAGEALLSPSVTRRLINEFVARPGPGRPELSEQVGQLTDREREVVGLVARGLSNEDIGKRLYMSPATAKTHVNRAMVKLGARDRARDS